MRTFLLLAAAVISGIAGVPRCASAASEEVYLRSCMEYNYAFADAPKKCACYASHMAQSAEINAATREAFLQGHVVPQAIVLKILEIRSECGWHCPHPMTGEGKRGNWLGGCSFLFH